MTKEAKWSKTERQVHFCNNGGCVSDFKMVMRCQLVTLIYLFSVMDAQCSVGNKNATAIVPEICTEAREASNETLCK